MVYYGPWQEGRVHREIRRLGYVPADGSVPRVEYLTPGPHGDSGVRWHAGSHPDLNKWGGAATVDMPPGPTTELTKLQQALDAAWGWAYDGYFGTHQEGDQNDHQAAGLLMSNQAGSNAVVSWSGYSNPLSRGGKVNISVMTEDLIWEPDRAITIAAPPDDEWPANATGVEHDYTAGIEFVDGYVTGWTGVAKSNDGTAPTVDDFYCLVKHPGSPTDTAATIQAESTNRGVYSLDYWLPRLHNNEGILDDLSTMQSPLPGETVPRSWRQPCAQLTFTWAPSRLLPSPQLDWFGGGTQWLEQIALEVVIEYRTAPYRFTYAAPLGSAYNRVVQRGSDGLGLSGGRRILQGRTVHATNRRGAAIR